MTGDEPKESLEEQLISLKKEITALKSENKQLSELVTKVSNATEQGMIFNPY